MSKVVSEINEFSMKMFPGVLDVKGGGLLCYPHLFKDGGILIEWSGRDQPSEGTPVNVWNSNFYLWDMRPAATPI